MTEEPPPPVQAMFEQLKDEREGYLQLRHQRGGWYVQHATSVWDKAEKKPKKVTTHLGTIAEDGEFIPKTPRESVPVTDREIFEYANGQLAMHFLEDVQNLLGEYTPYADELVVMAIIRAIDPQPLRLHPSRWEKLYLSQELDVRVAPKHLSKVLHETGTGKGWWHAFFTDLMDSDDLLLYDLTTIFSWSEQIKRVEKGYNADHLYRDQLGVVLAFSTATNLPVGVDVFWGSLKDITTFKEFLEVLEPAEVGFIGDRGLFSEALIEGFAAEGINYIIPLRKNSRLIDLRWLRWHDPFVYRGRGIDWARRHHDLGTVYLFEDPKMRGEQVNTLKRRLAQGEINRETYEEKQEQAGIVALLSSLERDGSEIYDLYKGRHDVELAFDAMKNHLDADKTHLQDDDAVRGYFFVTLLSLRVYFGVLERLRQEELTGEISVNQVFFELSKVERIRGRGEKESFAKIPSSAEDIVDVFPEAVPMV